MNSEISMRDSFINKVYELAKQDRDVVIVSADMGAPALDQIRDKLKGQFVNTGIAEHDMIAIASGLAQEGKKPFTMAIMPFTTSRVHEFIKLNAGLMKIPIKILGIGAGFSYDDSGPTHHTTEDISILRVIPNLEILSPSDSNMARAIAEIAYKSKNPTYIRLDRKILPDLSQYYISDLFERGFKEIETGDKIVIISTGNMVHRALEVREKLKEQGVNIGVIDLYKLKPINSEIKELLSKYEIIVSLEEHLLAGGLGSIISEIITDNDLKIRLKRIGVNEVYPYLYMRENIHKKLGLDVNSIVQKIKEVSEN